MEWGLRTLDQWYAELRFRKICAEQAAKLKRESIKARKAINGEK